jgi:diguanylate cyclase (GGDEF)-like protein
MRGSPEERGRVRGILTVLSGPEAGRVVPVGARELTLGRAEGCGLRFDDDGLSRQHAAVVEREGRYVFSDSGSTNGSFINQARVTAPMELANGARIHMGTHTTLRFSLVDEAEEATLTRMYESARQDPLTGLGNRRLFEERLDAEVAFAQRHGAPLSLLMLDVDFFKRVNDAHGHPAGDTVLRAVGAVIGATIRREDTAARYGGEEFAVLCRGVALAGAAVLADRLRLTIGVRPVPLPSDKRLHVTVSIGVASLACCGAAPSKSDLVSRADTRLYRAKERGRDRVVIVGEGGRETGREL